jgi:hypothetical protein
VRGSKNKKWYPKNHCSKETNTICHFFFFKTSFF